MVTIEIPHWLPSIRQTEDAGRTLTEHALSFLQRLEAATAPDAALA